jgi:hypothetical protein
VSVVALQAEVATLTAELEQEEAEQRRSSPQAKKARLELKTAALQEAIETEEYERQLLKKELAVAAKENTEALDVAEAAALAFVEAREALRDVRIRYDSLRRKAYAAKLDVPVMDTHGLRITRDYDHRAFNRFRSPILDAEW